MTHYHNWHLYDNFWKWKRNQEGYQVKTFYFKFICICGKMRLVRGKK